MGWTYYHAPAGSSTRDLIVAELNSDIEIVAQGMTGKVWYAAARYAGSDEVFALVALTDRRSRTYHNFGYKLMDESVGPCEAHAPKRVLQVLTPTTSEWAGEWRTACWANLRREAQAKALAVGTVIKTSSLDFGRFRADTFRLVDPKRNRFVAVGTDRTVNLGSDWATRFAYEVVSA